MRFVYYYRTKQNEICRGEMTAADREAVFQKLKAQGIRPSKVDEAPGLLNKLFGKGKRWIAISVLAVIAVASLCIAFALNRTLEETEQSGVSPLPRHQIYGDPALMGELERENYAKVFAAEGDCILARFAQPGIFVKAVAVDERKRWAALLAQLGPQILPEQSDSRETSELKRIVLWMRNELTRYLANGNGTTETYLKRLYERQNREFMIYNQAKTELKDEKDPAKFEQLNASLRRLGIKTIPPPEDLK